MTNRKLLRITECQDVPDVIRGDPVITPISTFEDAQRAEARAERAKARPAKNANRNNAASEVPAIQNQAATTSLGENDALAALKAKMEKGE